MNKKYLLLIALTLPAASTFAADNGARAASPGFAWGNFAAGCGEKMLVGAASAAATVAIGTLLKEWLTPSDPNSSILTRDRAIENTRQYAKDLRTIAATTDNKELAEQCLRDAELAEMLHAKGIVFRNQAFAKLCGKGG